MPPVSHPHGLDDSPNELLLAIFANLPARDLYNLATLSRRFHLLALPLYFAHYDIDITQAPEKLALNKQSLAALPGLLIYSELVSTKHLSYRFAVHRDRVISEARGLQRLVSKFATVECLTLSVIPEWPSRPVATWKAIEWEKAVLALLRGVSEKSCKSLRVFWRGTDPESYQIKARADEPIPLKPLKLSAHVIKRTWSKLSGRPSEANLRQFVRTQPEMQTFYTDSLMPFLPQLWEWTIETLNSSPITSVTFVQITTPLNWAEFLPWLTLPQLTTLSIKESHIPFFDLSQFLLRHPSITNLDLKDSALEVYTKYSSPRGILPQLTALTANPQHILYFLRHENLFPDLTDIRMVTRIVSGVHYDLRYIRPAFRSFAHIMKDIALRLEFADTADVAEWMDVENVPKNGHSERLLRNVKSIEIFAPPGFLSAMINLLPGWLALFPSLNSVSLRDCLEGRINDDVCRTFARSLRMACSKLETLRIMEGSASWSQDLHGQSS